MSMKEPEALKSVDLAPTGPVASKLGKIEVACTPKF